MIYRAYLFRGKSHSYTFANNERHIYEVVLKGINNPNQNFLKYFVYVDNNNGIMTVDKMQTQTIYSKLSDGTIVENFYPSDLSVSFEGFTMTITRECEMYVFLSIIQIY